MLARTILAATAFVVAGSFAGITHAASGCEAKADEKKLAGAARTSFVKKCVSDASAAK